VTEAEQFLERRRISPAEMRGDFWFRRDNFVRPESYVAQILEKHKLRDDFIAEFGFAILTEAVTHAIAQFSPLLEVGSGSGYWSYELRKAGCDVIPTDPGTGKYRFGWESTQTYWSKQWLEIERIVGVKAVKNYPNRNLLLVVAGHERVARGHAPAISRRTCHLCWRRPRRLHGG